MSEAKKRDTSEATEVWNAAIDKAVQVVRSMSAHDADERAARASYAEHVAALRRDTNSATEVEVSDIKAGDRVATTRDVLIEFRDRMGTVDKRDDREALVVLDGPNTRAAWFPLSFLVRVQGTSSASTQSAPELRTTAALEAIAHDADCDVRTVLRRLAGVVVRPRLARRIDAAIARHRRASSTNPPPKTAA